MSKLLLLFIRIYWLIPKKWRRKCLFKETCSAHVYKTAKEKGFREGIHSLKLRIRKCKPSYGFYTTDDGKEWVILADQSIIDRDLTSL